MATKTRTVLFIGPQFGGLLPRTLAGTQAVADAKGWHFFQTDCVRGPAGEMRFLRSPAGASLEEILSLLRPDGCIVARGVVSAAAVRAAAGRGRPDVFPVVLTDYPPEDVPQERGVPYATGDAVSFARLAARELLLSGFSDFAYAPWIWNTPWSARRGAEFARLVRLAGRRFHEFPRPRGGTDGSALADQFVPWIASLPKPCGVFAANDTTGEAVLNACARLRVAVPSQLAVVGVDDLPFICENVRPTLSSIQRDLEGEGRAAALLLDEWMPPPRRVPASRVVPAASLVRRDSSRFAWNRDRRVARAQEWIRVHACEHGLRPRDVVREMGVSAATAARLFRATAGHTLVEEIREARIARAKTRLHAGTPCETVAAECGFSSVLDFRRVFRRCTGLPVVAWTKRQATDA